MKKIYICSPYRAINEEKLKENIEKAKILCKQAVNLGCLPICPHLYFPGFLDDSNSLERNLGIAMARDLLAGCDEVWVLAGEKTEGMKAEIKEAELQGVKIHDVIIDEFYRGER